MENISPQPMEVVTSSRTIPTLERGKIPPQDLELEEVVLGGMLIEKRGVDEVIDILSDEAFYSPAHQKIYAAIYKLFKDSQPIDLMTVKDQLLKDGTLKEIGGGGYLVYLTERVSSSANIEFHARILIQKYIQRRLIKMSNEIIEEAYDEETDVFDLLDSAEGKLFSITQGNITRTSESAKELVIKARKKIEELHNRKEEFSGIPSGFTKVDELTAGWQPTDLIIVAARPAVGKTAFALNIAQNIGTKLDKTVAIFSLEMGAESLVDRMLAAEGLIESHSIRTGQLTDEEWSKYAIAQGNLAEASIYIDDTPGIRITEIRSRARKLAQETGNLGLILIDYLQLITGTGRENRQQEVSEISRQLKILAKELKVPVIALSQLSRSVEQRQDKRPVLSDIRESGSIEQDADIVAFLYRDDYYERGGEETEGIPNNKVEVIIEKNRSGARGTVELIFQKEYNKFSSISKREE